MAALTNAQRARLPAEAFGLPARRAYPLGVPTRTGWKPDATHIAAAKARARQMLERRDLTRKDYETIVRRANNAARRI